MPIVTINKTIALLLVGYLGMGLLALVQHERLLALLKREEISTAAGSVILGLLSLAAAALLGGVIDSLADLTTRRFIKFAAEDDQLAWFFGQSEVFSNVARWRSSFYRQLSVKANDQLFSGVTGSDEISRRHLATGLLQAHASPQHVDWVLAHYSTYYLASNFAFFLLIATPVLALEFVHHIRFVAWVGPMILAMMLSVYGLLSLSLDRCLYTYLAEFRFASIWLAEAAVNRTIDRKPSKLRPSPMG